MRCFHELLIAIPAPIALIPQPASTINTNIPLIPRDYTTAKQPPATTFPILACIAAAAEPPAGPPRPNPRRMGKQAQIAIQPATTPSPMPKFLQKDLRGSYSYFCSVSTN